jgi:hypothetical protein
MQGNASQNCKTKTTKTKIKILRRDLNIQWWYISHI